MAHRTRLKEIDVTPAYEDAGLFKNEVCKVRMSLCPIFFSNTRNDLIVRGVINDGLTVDVLFAGRRTVRAKAMVQSLEALKSNAFIQARRAKTELPDALQITLPVEVEGAWRRVVEFDKTGWQSHFYNLVAARWRIIKPGHSGALEGEQPVIPVVPVDPTESKDDHPPQG